MKCYNHPDSDAMGTLPLLLLRFAEIKIPALFLACGARASEDQNDGAPRPDVQASSARRAASRAKNQGSLIARKRGACEIYGSGC